MDCQSVAKVIFAETPVQVRTVHATMATEKVQTFILRQMQWRFVGNVERITRLYLALVRAENRQPKAPVVRRDLQPALKRKRFDWGKHQLRA